MGTIYDKLKQKTDTNLTDSYFDDVATDSNENINEQVRLTETASKLQSQESKIVETQDTAQKSQNIRELEMYQSNAAMALTIVDDVILKQYLTKLEHFEIMPDIRGAVGEDVIIYKINRMAYEKDEFATDKFVSALSAMTYAQCSIFLIVDGYAVHTDFYIGIKNADDKKTNRSVAETFKSSIKGQFPGVSMTDCAIVDESEHYSKQHVLLNKINRATCISSCVGVPSFKDEKGNYTNNSYIQGIEKLAIAMQGRRYTAIILAENNTPVAIADIRQGYENLYTQLSAVSTQQITYNTNESLANAISRSKSFSHSTTDSETHGKSTTKSKGTSQTYTEAKSQTHAESYSESNRSFISKVGSVAGGALAAVGGVALMATGIGIPAGLAMVGAGAGLAAAGASAKQKTKGYTNSTGETSSYADGVSHSTAYGSSESKAHGVTEGETFTQENGQTATVTDGKSFTITVHNKHIEELQKKIDKQLERISCCESNGLWSAATYFFSYDNDLSSAETGAAIFRSIMQGESSGVEASAVNTWIGNNSVEGEKKVSVLNNTICRFRHPIFNYKSREDLPGIAVENSSLLSSKELSMLMGLPRKSVPGFPVVEHVCLGKEVVRHGLKSPKSPLLLGAIYDQGVVHTENTVKLDVKSLTQHVFITGSTGCGKSNTIFYLIKQICNQVNAPKFMVIEPAKGEYKDVFGNVHVYGTNPLTTPLLKINPFRFPEGVHVLEHIDRLVEIFNVCWPMYAAMPAVLKEAILNAYENSGWDLYHSTNRFSNDLFPTFVDLLNELVQVINTSAYSEEVKSNYQGSLVTRVKSLNNGLCKHIFSNHELGDSALFDENVIVDLSRVGSQETKSLIMGILIVRLNEYRSNSNIRHNSDLRHITILEEAHNILKRDSAESCGEQGNVSGKSVEIISNAIAEMRTYGEGFIIVDQSPEAVDAAAIRNTNTKIIMRLPDDSDRKVAGKASGMKDSQVDEIAKLPTGVAVVYQNDWEEPVLCKVGKFEEEEVQFKFHPEDNNEIIIEESATKSEILKLLLKGRITENIDANIEIISDNLSKLNLSTFNKIAVYGSVNEFKKFGRVGLWNDDQFEKLSRLVTELLNAKSDVGKYAESVSSFEDLTEMLEQYIKHDIPEIPDELLLVISQCLMRDYSLSGEIQKKIYSAWFLSVKNKILS